MALGDQEGIYLENMLNYIIGLANQRGSTLNAFLDEISLPEEEYVYPGVNEEDVRGPEDIVDHFRFPEIPDTADSSSYRDMAESIQKKVLTPLLSGSIAAVGALFPGRSILLDAEISALEGVFDGSLLAADMNRTLDVQMQMGKDAAMKKLLADAANISYSSSGQGFPVMPGSAVRAVQTSQFEAIEASRKVKEQAVKQRLDSAAKLLRAAIESVLGYRQLILSAMLEYIKEKIAALNTGAALTGAALSQNSKLMSAVSGYASSLQNLEALRLNSIDNRNTLDRARKLNDNVRANANVEKKMRAVAEVTDILSKQAAAALNTLSASGSVTHQVR